MTLTNRTLAIIADDLRSALKRQTGNILIIGGLLIEAKAQVGHGEWLPWLKKEFSISERSAQKYIKAAELAAKYELGADLKLSPSALYLLSEDHYWEDGDNRHASTHAVINAAKDQRVGYHRAKEIIDQLSAEEAKQKARETAMAEAMAGDMEIAEREANERQECWADKKDEWIKDWTAKNWGDEQEAKFETEWHEENLRNHELPDAAAAELPSSTPVEQPPPNRTALTGRAETRPRSAAAKHRDTRIMDCHDHVKGLIGEIMKTVSDPVYDNRDRMMLRHEFTPHLDGIIDHQGKRRFDPSSPFMAVNLTLTENKLHDPAPEKQANDNTSQPGQDEVA